MSCNSIQLNVPQHNLCLLPGQIVKLHRFESEKWVLGYGWYAWGGNREVCGWYLTSCDDKHRIKPLQKPDLDDIYCVTM